MNVLRTRCFIHFSASLCNTTRCSDLLPVLRRGNRRFSAHIGGSYAGCCIRTSQNSPSRNCLKSLASFKTNASKPTKQSKEGSFRCDMTAISALETLLSDFLDSFWKENSQKFAHWVLVGRSLVRRMELVCSD